MNFYKLIFGFILCSFTVNISAQQEVIYFYHTDAWGTPVAMTDEEGDVIWRGEHMPFGTQFSQTGTFENNRGFLGKENDYETGLANFGSRMLDPRIGRFYSCDPVTPVNPLNGQLINEIISSPQRLNQYTYAINNPNKFVDENGEYLELAFEIVSIGLSLNDFISNPTLGNAAWLALDVVGAAIPIIPSAGIIRHGAKLDNLIDLTKSVDKVASSTKGKARFIADQAGNVLDTKVFQGLEEVSISVKGTRGGTQLPLFGKPGTFANLGNGHKIIYGADGRALFDVSKSRVKAISWNQAPNGKWFPAKGSNTKFQGPVPQTVLDDLNF